MGFLQGGFDPHRSFKVQSRVQILTETFPMEKMIDLQQRKNAFYGGTHQSIKVKKKGKINEKSIGSKLITPRDIWLSFNLSLLCIQFHNLISLKQYCAGTVDLPKSMVWFNTDFSFINFRTITSNEVPE